MEPLDLRKFLWIKDHIGYSIIALTDFREHNVIVYRAIETGQVGVKTIADFCEEFTATYQINPD